MVGVVVYGVFVHRWNDGYENVFSDLYRAHLRFKWWLLGSLNDQEVHDLSPSFRSGVRFGEGLPSLNEKEGQAHKAIDPSLAMERPEKKHVIEAQRILQEREERMLRALDIAEGELAKAKAKADVQEQVAVPQSKSWWRS